MRTAAAVTRCRASARAPRAGSAPSAASAAPTPATGPTATRRVGASTGGRVTARRGRAAARPATGVNTARQVQPAAASQSPRLKLSLPIRRCFEQFPGNRR